MTVAAATVLSSSISTTSSTSNFRYLTNYFVKQSVSTSTLQQSTCLSSSISSNKAVVDRAILLQDRENDLEFYQTYFYDKPHYNYMATTSEQGPIIVSVIVDHEGCIRILSRTTQRKNRTLNFGFGSSLV
ncbi:hypothetical protein BX616_011001 [Lobosporangium transversale]|uniref:Uncharacterized protein n=1 Tax=Lobosporangium transversale TaxID=64571 RepID=A0A1Y2H232_9FUNG|nr:hypothetical protein BCR41DRAFT_297 [Lobosporangium transversale]KAF9909973.1 hypothetical protein BX616_011001 [Lobosporangium transversale]ORZ28608.1 hypothetical protein BCR41DRAFT_297 [Lobosporangium transversale]|eukprot:XP_021886281.1 hypothetical protein BCR41DRAFT_297 [Lobosporangium transversale]